MNIQGGVNSFRFNTAGDTEIMSHTTLEISGSGIDTPEERRAFLRGMEAGMGFCRPWFVERPTFFYFTMPCCGLSYRFETADDVPIEDKPCECGAPGYYVIRYRVFDETVPDAEPEAEPEAEPVPERGRGRRRRDP